MLGVAGFWASEWPRDGGGGGRKGEGEKEEMSMSQPRMEPKSERENEGNVCDRQTTSREGHRDRDTVRELGEEGSESQRWSEERGECWGMDYGGPEIREDESRVVVGPLGVRGNMLNLYVCFPVCLASRLSERLALIALPLWLNTPLGKLPEMP